MHASKTGLVLLPLLSTHSVIEMEDPQIAKVYLRSDNAGYYHNTKLLLSLQALAASHGMVFVRYDFSDSQSWKDVCGWRIALMKTHIRCWVNEGRDVTTAEEVKVARVPRWCPRLSLCCS